MVIRRMSVRSSGAIERRPRLPRRERQRQYVRQPWRCHRHRFGLYDQQRGMPPIQPATRQNPETPVRILKARTWLAPLEDHQLLPQAKIVCDQQRLWLDNRSNRPQQTAKHRALSPFLNRQEADAVSIASMTMGPCGSQLCTQQFRQ